MYKKVIIVFLIIIFISFGMIEKLKGAPDLYFLDITNNQIRMVGNRSYNIYDVIWSGDSKYFMFNSNKGNYYSDTGITKLRYLVILI